MITTYARYLTDGYSPSVAHSVAICSAIRSIFAFRADINDGLYMHWNVSGESSENTWLKQWHQHSSLHVKTHTDVSICTMNEKQR